MRDECTHDDTVGLQKEAGCEAIPDDDGGVCTHEKEHRQISKKAQAVVPEALPGNIEVDETADDEHHEIKNQILVIVVFIDEADIHKDEHDIDRCHQTYGAAFLCRNIVQRDENAVEDAVHEHGHEQEDDQHPVLVLVPDFTYRVEIDAITDDVVERQQEQNRGARKRHLVEGFDKFVRAGIHRIEHRPAGTAVPSDVHRSEVRAAGITHQPVVEFVVLVSDTAVRVGTCVEVRCIGILRGGGRGTVAVELLTDARERENHAHHEDEAGERNEEKRHGRRHVEVMFDVVEIFHGMPLLS